MRDIDINKGNGVFSVNGVSSMSAEEKSYLNGESFDIGRNTINAGDIVGYEKKEVSGRQTEYLWRMHGKGEEKGNVQLLEISEAGRGPDIGSKIQEWQKNGVIYLNANTTGSKVPMSEVLEGSKEELLERRQLSRDTLNKIDESIYGKNQGIQKFNISKDPEDVVQKQSTTTKKTENNLHM